MTPKPSAAGPASASARSSGKTLRAGLSPGRTVPLLALAPMQDVTDWAFCKLMQRYGGPDIYVTEYFRVTPGAHPSRFILKSITENATDRPIVAQMIGNDPAELARFSRELLRHPVAGIDLNLGCPAPVVYRKCAGGGLLREPARIAAILAALRDAVQGVPLSVKTRVGFDDPDRFDEFLAIFARHGIDFLTVHGRTVAEGYTGAVHYDLIARAARTMPCPVLANGGVVSAAHAEAVYRETGAHGLMIGRGAIRNPWIFRQIRSHFAGEPPSLPSGRDVLAYIHELFAAVTDPDAPETGQVTRMKKHLNYLGAGLDRAPDFLHRIRRVRTRDEFFTICSEHLDHPEPMPLEP